MQLWPRTRLLCTEPLEGRWLLSGAAELESPDERDEHDADDVDVEVGVATSDLPAPVVAAIHARYPDAELVEAVLTTDGADDVSAYAYEVSARSCGQTFELTLAQSGTILEIEPLAPPASEPQTLLVPSVVDEPEDDVAGEAQPVGETTTTASAPATNTVEVVEIEPAEKDEADGDIDVARWKLPRTVLDAFNARFPGATWMESEFGIDDGSSEFDITADFQGHVIDVTLTPAGEIIETEQAVTSDQLPQEVLDWVRDRFGADAEIDEATVMFEDGELGYEVLVEASDGQEMEATLRVPGAQPPDGFPIFDDAPETPVVPPPDETVVATSASGGAGADDVAGGFAGAAVEAGESGVAAVVASSETASTQAGQAAAQQVSVEDEGITAADAIAAGARVGQAVAVAEALQALAAGAPPAVWLPGLAGVLDDVLPVDVAAVERGLDEILREVESIAAGAADALGSAAAARDGLSPLAVAAALIAATQLFLLNSRRARGGGPVLVFNAAASSWSWVLGRRPRRSRKGHSPRTLRTLMNVDSLDELLEKLNGGDHAAAEQAFVAYEPYLRKVVRRLLPAELRPKFDSIDVVQSVYGDVLTAFRAGGMRFGTVSQLRAFLIKATRNRFIDRVRQNQTAARREQPIGDVTPERMPLSPQPRPSESAMARELWERLLSLCPPEHHALLRLRRRGASASEIAAEVGMHEGSVRRVLRDLSVRLACTPMAAASSSSSSSSSAAAAKAGRS